MKDRDFYLRVMGLSDGATPEDIRKMYLELAKILHPDRHNNSDLAKKKFQELQEAYEYLLNHPKTESSGFAKSQRKEQESDFTKPNTSYSSNSHTRRKSGTFPFQYISAMVLVIGIPFILERYQLLDGKAPSRPLNNQSANQSNNIPTQVDFQFSGCKETDYYNGPANPLTFTKPSRDIRCSFAEKYNEFDFAYNCTENPLDGSPIREYELSWVNGWRVPKLDNKWRFLADYGNSKNNKLLIAIDCNAETNSCKFLRSLGDRETLECSGTYNGKKLRDLTAEFDAMKIKTEKDDEARWSKAPNGIPSKLHGVYRAYASKLLGAELTNYKKDGKYFLEVSFNKMVFIFDQTKETGRKNCKLHFIYSGIKSINEEIKPEFVQIKQTNECPGGEKIADGGKNELKIFCLLLEGKTLIQQVCSPDCRNPFMKTGMASCKNPDTHYLTRVSP